MIENKHVKISFVLLLFLVMVFAAVLVFKRNGIKSSSEKAEVMSTVSALIR